MHMYPCMQTAIIMDSLPDQRGIHGFWESRVPELLAEKNGISLLAKLIT